MPNTSSAKKANRQNETNRSRNSHFKAMYKENVKKLEKSIKAGVPVEEANSMLSKVYSSIDKLVKKNIIHKGNGSRKKIKSSKLLKTFATSIKDS